MDNLDKLKSCLACGAVFAQARKDQTCCQPKCAKVFRSRRWRANQPRYRDNRKWNDYKRFDKNR
jgi:hypothetical protein